jgi:hypothetical protein
MAVGTGYSKVASSGLVFAYDTGDTYNSYLGRPTTNVLANYGMSTYNNVPGNVSSNLYTTSETYRGATVWRQDLTAADGSGAYYLSNGNNPGIGVVTGGGGGSANTYTGHTIYFKPTVPMHGNPIYTCYSNIGGWQSCYSYEDMGDGWFRAYVLWYDTVGRSDGKYWAINPASTSVGQTVTIYWAGPFREDLNSTSISQFVNGTRSTSQAIIDVGAYSTITANNGPFSSPAINPQLNFDGSNDTLSIPNNSSINVSGNITMELILNRSAGNDGVPIHKDNQYTIRILSNGTVTYADSSLWSYASFGYHGNVPSGQNNHLVATKSGSLVTIYLNGTVIVSQNFGGPITQTNNTLYIGAYDGSSTFFSGQISVAKIYNRTLSAAEIRDNYSHYKTRFNLP